MCVFTVVPRLAAIREPEQLGEDPAAEAGNLGLRRWSRENLTSAVRW